MELHGHRRQSRHRGRYVALAALLLLGGCIPLPFITPPAELSVAPGVSTGSPPPPSNWQGIGRPTTTSIHAGVYPLGLIEEKMGRDFDFGVGWAADLGPNGAFTHGVYGEFRGHPWVDFHDRSRNPAATRFAVHGIGEALFNPLLGWGAGVGIGTSFEFSQFVSGSIAEADYNGAIIGSAHGEWGGGGGIDFTYRRLPGSWWVGATLRFRIRIPASAGVALIPIDL